MTNDRRITRVITRLNIGGPARHVLILNKGLDEHGYRSHLIHGAESDREGSFSPGGLSHTLVPELTRRIELRHEAVAQARILDVIRRSRPQVVHTHMAKAGFHGRIAASRAGVPVIIHTFHGHVLEGYFSRPMTKALVAIERRLAARSTALIAVSEEIRDSLFDLGIGTEQQWRVIPLGLDLAGFLSSQLDARDARQRLGLPPDVPAVGIVGRLAPIKDVSSFIAAAKRVLDFHGAVTFVIAGDGELRSELEAEAYRVLGPTNQMVWLGWVDDLRTLYAALDVVVLTSRNEGTPVALIEAAAAGKPVVATKVGGVGQVVVDGTTGFLTAPSDPDATACAVVRLLATPELARAYGDAGREHVSVRFSSERLLADVARLYDQLV